MPTGPVKTGLMRKVTGRVWSGELQGMALQAWDILRGLAGLIYGARYFLFS